MTETVIPTTEIGSWAHLVETLEPLVTSSRHEYIYRGQAQDWPLVPSLLREGRESLERPQLVLIEKETLEEFQRAAHLFLPPY